MTDTKYEISEICEINSHIVKNRIESTQALHHRTIVTWEYIYSIQANFALRQRSEFIPGWEYAAKVGTTVTTRTSA